MFIAALFTVAKTWKQPKWPSTDEWIKMWYIYTMEKNEIMPFAAIWMQLEIIIPRGVSQKEKGKYHMISYVESIIWNKWTYLQKRTRLTDIENRLVVAEGEEGGNGMDRDFGVGRCKLLCLEWISNDVLLCSTETYIQSLGIDHYGRKHKKEKVYVCYGSRCCTAETGITL